MVASGSAWLYDQTDITRWIIAASIFISVNIVESLLVEQHISLVLIFAVCAWVLAEIAILFVGLPHIQLLLRVVCEVERVIRDLQSRLAPAAFQFLACLSSSMWVLKIGRRRASSTIFRLSFRSVDRVGFHLSFYLGDVVLLHLSDFLRSKCIFSSFEWIFSWFVSRHFLDGVSFAESEVIRVVSAWTGESLSFRIKWRPESISPLSRLLL